MSRYSAIALFFCVLLLSGCASLPDDYGLYQEEASPWAIEQNNQHLQSINSLIQSGKGNAAKQEADLINPAELAPEQQAQYNLLTAQIMLSFGEAEQAVGKLAITEVGQLSINDKIKLYQSQAFAYSLTGNRLESIKARISLDDYLTNPDERKKNQGVILESLGLLTDTDLQNQKFQSNLLPEWLAVAKILKTRNQKPSQFNNALASWKAANPEHPANLYLASVKTLPNETTSIANENGNAPGSIALLLPESGPFLDPARAIKAGFLEAHSRDHSSSIKPILHFYNTEKGKTADLYQKAVADGAKLVVGPLTKENIQSLATANLTVPVLALNHVPSVNKQNLYQFALSPIDDVAEITKKAALDGHKKAVLMVPKNEQGKRVSAYLSEDWASQGGTLLNKQTYDPNKSDLAKVINSLLGTTASSTPATTPEQAAPTSQPAANSPEADALFLSAYSKEGRKINSIIEQGSKLPVYALPAIYSGIADPMNDTPLNGITFCDMPWLFKGAYSGELGVTALSNVISQFPISYIRLVAMGIDAYHLADKLSTLNASPFPGATGTLSLDYGNRIKRGLVCAKFASGQPELIGFTHSPTESDFSGTAKPPVSAMPPTLQ